MIRIENNRKDVEFIYKYLTKHSSIFTPPLKGRLNLVEYSKKIYTNAIQIWAIEQTKNETAGFIACYLNDQEHLVGYITTISVIEKFQGKKIGYDLLMHLIKLALQKGFNKLRLEVNTSNTSAINFYMRNGFIVAEENSESFYLELKLNESNLC